MADHPRGSETSRRWVSMSELADLLGVSLASVAKAHKLGRFRTIEVLPGLVRVDLTSLPAGEFCASGFDVGDPGVNGSTTKELP